MLVLGCTSKVFPVHKEIESYDFWKLLQLDFSIFPNSWKRLKIRILNISIDCTSKFLPKHYRVWKLGILKFLGYIFYMMERVAKVHIYIIILWQIKCWKNSFNSLKFSGVALLSLRQTSQLLLERTTFTNVLVHSYF